MRGGAPTVGTADRRAAPRVPIGRCLVRVRRCACLVWVPYGREYTARALDLSFDGLAFKGREHFRAGECVVVDLQPNCDGPLASERLRLRGRVVRSEAHRGGSRETVGIRFIGRRRARHAAVSAWASRIKRFLD